MKKIRVNLGERSYSILVGEGAIKKLPSIIKSMPFSGPIVLITDRTVFKRAKCFIAPIFRKIPNVTIPIVVPAAELSKSFKVFQDVIQSISEKTKTHSPLVIALGGGVVGDLAGFVAATYRRGVPFIQVPTTLLAQVDSAIGGKTAIDLKEAKNLVGAFYQPKAVLADTAFLKTLSQRQIRNGMAEVIKYAIIKDKALFSLLEDHMEDVLLLRKEKIEKVIYKCAVIKARVVQEDEFDKTDKRIILNFGHTLGHAIESASSYSKVYNHGEAIAIGMVLAAEIAVQLDMLKEGELARIKNLIKKAGLSLEIKLLSIKRIMSSYGYDKKFISGTNRFVLPRGIGRVEVVEDIPPLLIRTVLKRYVRHD